jgi:hypothetical protein
MWNYIAIICFLIIPLNQMRMNSSLSIEYELAENEIYYQEEIYQ